MAEGDGVQSGAEDGSQSGTGETTTDSNSGTDNANSNDSGTQGGTKNPEAEQARREAESLRERMKAADRRAADFEAKLKQITDKDLPEAEKLKRDYEESQKVLNQLKNVNRDLALKVAFLSDNTYAWHNPERALKLADLEGVTIEDDGSVSGLKAALDALAKSDAYLLKTEKDEVDKTPPGTAPGNNGSNGSTGPRKGAMESRLPVLRTRVRG